MPDGLSGLARDDHTLHEYVLVDLSLEPLGADYLPLVTPPEASGRINGKRVEKLEVTAGNKRHDRYTGLSKHRRHFCAVPVNVRRDIGRLTGHAGRRGSAPQVGPAAGDL